MLHIISKSPFSHDAFQSCLRLALPGSDLLLIENGVYAGLSGTDFGCQLQAIQQIHKLYALEDDILARGIQERLIAGIQLINYGGFVDLVAINKRIQTWR